MHARRPAAKPRVQHVHALPGYGIRENLDPRAVPRLDLPDEPKPHSIHLRPGLGNLIRAAHHAKTAKAPLVLHRRRPQRVFVAARQLASELAQSPQPLLSATRALRQPLEPLFDLRLPAAAVALAVAGPPPACLGMRGTERCVGEQPKEI